MNAAPVLVRLPDQGNEPVRNMLARVESVATVAPGYCRITVASPGIASVRAGQFCMLGSVDWREGRERMLPRPMAVHEHDRGNGTLGFVCKLVGDGTRQLANLTPGDRIRLIGPLGHGFDLRGEGPVLLLGRGVGTFSLGLVPSQVPAGRPVTVLLSARDSARLLGVDHFERLGCTVLTVTDQDGTSSVPAVADLLRARFGAASRPGLVLSCGSRRLMDLGFGLARSWGARMQTSVEANMACGLGYCHGCASPVGSEDVEAPLVCVDGPVFELRPSGTTNTGEEDAEHEHTVAVG